MASGYLFKFERFLFSHAVKPRHLNTHLVPFRHKSNVVGASVDGFNSDVAIGVTSDGETIVCYHPPIDYPYEFTQPLERPDPVTNPPESHDQVLKAHLSDNVMNDKPGPSIEELSKMFFTTKHRWYPKGQFHMRRIKKDPPKDR
ncbi:39S ribosomal protein L42, mitochondrial [Thalassophryne amazonica]|uniref:39S ribosomal protein L42, mitochondrial n=1 Tax=Thalassophryne amazonica TaxID=390379 RepID=UPI00147182C3|nr:39S ribosomal protein L42, mitochondrial [Thalassophryne amazonica]